MPEYLSPAVYVEEVDTGSKPIEGVSTSTSGMVGVAERGPLNVPILITSFGEFRRWFGDLLPDAGFSNATGFHCYLPHAVQGFFTNGGKRVYVTRAPSLEEVERELPRPSEEQLHGGWDFAVHVQQLLANLLDGVAQAQVRVDRPLLPAMKAELAWRLGPAVGADEEVSRRRQLIHRRGLYAPRELRPNAREPWSRRRHFSAADHAFASCSRTAR